MSEGHGGREGEGGREKEDALREGGRDMEGGCFEGGRARDIFTSPETPSLLYQY